MKNAEVFEPVAYVETTEVPLVEVVLSLTNVDCVVPDNFNEPFTTVFDCKLTFVDEPNTCKFPDTYKSPPNDVIEPEPTVNAPVTLVLP